MKQQEKPAKNLLTRIRNLTPKNRFAAVISSSILSLALAATTCGTFAWFTYASNVYVEDYKGVSIGAVNLDMGYVSHYEFNEANIYGVDEVQKTVDGDFIYWFNDGISLEALHKLIALNGYAYTELYPVTTGSYSKLHDDFSLLRAPTSLGSYTRDTKALPEQYTHMPLVFRVFDQLNPGKYLNDFDVYMSVADIKSDFDIKESFRIHTDNLVEDEGKMKHLINIDHSISGDGFDEVGGVLDLNGDGFYDTREDTLTGKVTETYYGEFENAEGYSSDDVYYKNSPRSSDSEQVGDHTTFNAKHREGAYEIDENITKPMRAEYETIEKFENEITPITRTKDYKVYSIIDNQDVLKNEYLAFVNVTIFIEGWDLKCVDPEIAGQERLYDLSLSFEVLI